MLIGETPLKSFPLPGRRRELCKGCPERQELGKNWANVRQGWGSAGRGRGDGRCGLVGGEGGLVHEGREKVSDGLKFPCLPFLLSLKITFN